MTDRGGQGTNNMASTGMFSETDNARSEVVEMQKQLNASDETRAGRNGKLEAMRKVNYDKLFLNKDT